MGLGNSHVALWEDAPKALVKQTTKVIITRYPQDDADGPAPNGGPQLASEYEQSGGQSPTARMERPNEDCKALSQLCK
ncbi:MAG: hypothetical protein OXU20_13615 [Myxococcales bacterium]|nr:hypothetical protein [Myxococcales bacterium]